MKLEPVIPQEHLAALGKAMQADLPVDTGNLPAELDCALARLEAVPEKNYLRLPVWVAITAGVAAVMTLVTLGLAVLLALR